jgi:tRNA(fMet)-specific endonuclease VapC
MPDSNVGWARLHCAHADATNHGMVGNASLLPTLPSSITRRYPDDRTRGVKDPDCSVITQAELLFGVLKKPEATKLKVAVREFLQRVEILPWDEDAADSYAKLRHQLERDGTPLGSMDMLIAAHAIAAEALLVTSDRAFHNAKPLLNLVDWSMD